MGNQPSDQPQQQQQPAYQRMGTEPASRGVAASQQARPLRRAKTQQPRQQGPAQQKVTVDQALDSLQSMFMLMDREVLRLVLMEQCEGNLDNAVETLLLLQQQEPPQQGHTQAVSSSSAQKASVPIRAKSVYAANEAMLYDHSMRAINVKSDFLQPPSYFLSNVFGFSQAKISDLQIQQQSHKDVALAMQQQQQQKQLQAQQQQPQQQGHEINLDPSIIGQWTNLMARYKFKSSKQMERIRDEFECKSLNRCGSLVRVIFMMKLYQRLCNESGSTMNQRSHLVMHEYLSRGFKEYSFTELMNDCNHLTTHHKLGGDALKSIIDEQQRNELLANLSQFFGNCDVFNCKIVQRILAKQDAPSDKQQISQIDVEQDIVDKYHRLFFHPLN